MAHPPSYPFREKHRWRIDLHFFSGVTLFPWLKLLRTYMLDIEWASYGHRVLFLTFMSVVNTLLAIPDWLFHTRGIANQQLHSQPCFIMGHPRTGTTHLHNLLSLDDSFSYATTFYAGFPSSFITLSCAWVKSMLSPLLSKTRPMDNMALTWQLPAEDEIATAVLSVVKNAFSAPHNGLHDCTGGASYYTPLLFPKREESLRPFLSLRTGPGQESLTPEQFAEWQDAFLHFLQKVTYSDCLTRPLSGAGSRWAPRPLLIKSPVHVGRMHLFLKMFPSAHHIYIHRHPLEVFQSAAHMADTYYWFTYLQRPDNAALTEFILRQYEMLYDEYMQHRASVPAGHLIEVSFEKLERDPLGTLKKIYDRFGWTERYHSLIPKFKAYCEDNNLLNFKKNQHNRLSSEMEAYVRERWGASFREFGYQ